MISIVLASLIFTAPARLVCPESPAKSVKIDGILDEWDEINPLTLAKIDAVKGGDRISSSSDLSVSIKCTTSKKEGIYFYIEITDSRIIRSKNPGKNDDHVELALGSKNGKILFYPPTDSYKGAFKGLPSKGKAKIVKKEGGWAVEFGVPFGYLGVIDGLPEMPFAFAAYDTDSSVAGKPETVVALDAKELPKMTRLEFGAARAMYSALLERLSLSDADVVQNHIGNFSDGKGVERAIWIDRWLVVMGGDIGSNFVSTGLGVAKSNVKRFQLIDIDGDGVTEFLTELTYGDSATERKVLIVWKAWPSGLKKIFSHLIEFKSGSHFIKNSYKTVKSGKRYKIVVKFDSASKSITKDSWKGDVPDSDTLDYIFPWAKSKTATFSFANGRYSVGR
ncbi:hypothetical protein KKF34_17960 [Myxococcota bacterium]|nr:hypothetical protein [Myxococcota bacterium]MBU1379885.1 hypothetical protein [Myxococcota bacterium]MBU1498770.1 hypothetical protein [Myxococcota bacterium]